MLVVVGDLKAEKSLNNRLWQTQRKFNGQGCSRSAIVDDVSVDNRTKSKISEVCKTLSGMRNWNRLSESVSKTKTVQIRYTKESRANTSNYSFHFFLSGSCAKAKYNAIVMISLKETEGVSDKTRV